MNQYEDMLDLPHYVSKKRSHMSMIDRGAQFSPFAALTGYEAVLTESARLTEDCAELSEGAEEALDQKLRQLCDRIRQEPWAKFTCFQPDERKAGGAYVTIEGWLKKYDYVEKCLILTDGTKVPLESIFSVETE